MRVCESTHIHPTIPAYINTHLPTFPFSSAAASAAASRAFNPAASPSALTRAASPSRIRPSCLIASPCAAAAACGGWVGLGG